MEIFIHKNNNYKRQFLVFGFILDHFFTFILYTGIRDRFFNTQFFKANLF